MRTDVDGLQGISVIELKPGFQGLAELVPPAYESQASSQGWARGRTLLAIKRNILRKLSARLSREPGQRELLLLARPGRLAALAD